MNKKLYLKSLADSVLQVFGLICLSEFSTSVYSASLTIEHLLMICALEAVVSATVFYFCLTQRPTDYIVQFTVSNFLNCVVLGIVAFVIKLTFHFSIIPARELGNADGIVLVIVILGSICLSFIFRLIVFGLLFRKSVDE